MSAPPVPRLRIAIPATAPGFHLTLKRWQDFVMQMAPPKAALRVIPYLLQYMNREYGRAWPTDKRIAAEVGVTRKTVSRGWKWLDDGGVIIRETRTKWSPTGEVEGSERRFYLAIPEGTSLLGLAVEMSHRAETAKTPETLGGTPMGHAPGETLKSLETLEVKSIF